MTLTTAAVPISLILVPFRWVLAILSFLFLSQPYDAASARVLIWLVRILTFSLILRTYIAPWLLTRVSKHVRVRSISLRSIRGIYFRKGAQTWRVDRIGYAWPSVQGHRRFAVKIDGVHLQIAKEKAPEVAKSTRRHTRNLTLADFNPSPLASYVWRFISTITSFLEPYFRPIIRTYVIACLRVGIQWLPKITQALSFDVHSLVIAFDEVPGAKISIDKIGLHSALDLVYLDTVPKPTKVDESKSKADARNAQGMGAWKKRMADSLQRSFDNALGDSRGTATFELEVCNVLGTMPRTPDPNALDVPFLRSPGDVQLELSVKFNPKEGALEPRGLSVSLKIGDCVVKADLLMKLLDKVVPKKKPKPPPLGLSLSSPKSAFGAFGPSPLQSSTSIGSAYPPAVHSAARSFSSSLFSPSSLWSPSEEKSAKRFSFSPISNEKVTSPSPKSPKSPISPFLSAISASMVMRQRRRHFVADAKKLTDHKDKSLLLALHSIQISVASVTLSVQTGVPSGPYRTIMEEIAFGISLSDPADNHLHREHLPHKVRGEVDSDAYAIKLSVAQVTLERQSSRTLPLIRVGTVSLQAIAHKWPAPLLMPMPFMSNDPNSSFLGVHLDISDIHMSDQIKDIQDVLESLKSRQGGSESTAADHPTSPSVPLPPGAPSFPVPRLAITVECGPITARSTYDVDNGESSRAIELRTNGFSVAASASYKQPSQAISKAFPAASSVQALHFVSALNMNFDPTLVRIRSARSALEFDDEDDDFLDEPPLLSIGTVEVAIDANAVAQIDGGFDATPIIDKATLLFGLSVIYDTICVELWHPTAVDAALCFVSLAPTPSEPKAKPSSGVAPPSAFAKLPDGLTARISVARFVVCITAPDLNPEDNGELSRGFSFRTSMFAEYCSLRPNQDHWFNNTQRSKNRLQLLLPVESLTDAITSAKAFGYPHSKTSFVKCRLSNLILSSAVATQYEPDDPAIAGRDDIIDASNRIMHIDEIQADIRLSSKRSPKQEQAYADACDISVKVPLIKAYFHLCHVYSILLALQTIAILKPPRPNVPVPKPTPTQTEHHGVNLSFHVNLPAVQARITLPTQNLVLRMDGLNARSGSGPLPRIKCTKAVLFVALPEANNRWEEPIPGQWGEFVTLQGLEVSLAKMDESLLVSVDGESGHIRIADGFVLSDLIHDASVAAKAIKHLVAITATGCYSDMLDPTAEGPKHVPHITVRLATLCLEAQDDPFESKLALIWQTGEEAVKQRIDREEAFKAKVAAIAHAEPEVLGNISTTSLDGETEYQFSTRHTVSIQEARRRLDDVHALDWVLRLAQAKEHRTKVEHSILHRMYGTFMSAMPKDLLDIMNLPAQLSDPPLVRAMMHNLCLTISPPSFSLDKIADVMYDMGGGLPKDTQFSLLVPLHIHFTLSSFKVTLRDYPLPLLHIPSRPDPAATSWTFDTDLIIAEEMGTKLSVDWNKCPIIEADQTAHGEHPFAFMVPKTIMPVKTYAAPIITITTPEPTVFSWGVSYGPAIQDLMRVVETLSSAPRDISPAVGFWDKLRLILHWTVKITFTGDIRLYMKGSRDPRKIVDDGTGFVLNWSGNPEIRVGYENPQKELIQVLSEGMLIAIPNLDSFNPESRGHAVGEKNPQMVDGPFLKVCARLSSGVRYGVGIVLERACGPECLFCIGSAFDRKCRYFSFRPHYEVKLELKSKQPRHPKDPDDSYNLFRSDFIHLSISLASFINRKASLKPSSLYFSPKMFAHFWSWCSLFDGTLTLPIRQGNYHPSRPISPKFGRHLATIKYRISLPNLYFVHGYIDGSRETWVDGVTPWVGLKGKVDELLVDMHQREEESVVPGPVPDTTRILRKKPFYAAEVVMKGLELRAMLATFSEPLKQSVNTVPPPQKSNYRKHTNLPTTPASSIWNDLEDFIELDWAPTDKPTLHLLPFATCPHFAYFKRNEAPSTGKKASKFGSEHSHICLLGKEPSVTKTQMNLASSRASELRKVISQQTESQARKASTRAMSKMITLLEDYVAVLKEVEIRPESDIRDTAAQNYHMPSDIVTSDEWAEFDNVYQIHCPSIFMDSALRDIMMQYYYCSRDRRGFEYHMSTRAVKFIRDQAKAVLAAEPEDDGAKERPSGVSGTAQMATTVLRKILKGENSTKIPIDVIRASNALVSDKVDPMSGWTEGVSLTKSHCCLLLKPQIILRGEGPGDKLVVAAAQAKLQSFAIMDLLNLDDPISGKVMSRNYTSLSGLQAFAPTDAIQTNNGAVPLEVLIDLRCESDAFERLVPQTDAVFHYDKFNRLRLRNNTTSSAIKNVSTEIGVSHLHDQTDLIRVHIPRFTVSANSEHFCTIANIVTKLLLFSDPAHKTRLDRVETLVFKYDFSDLVSASKVVSSLQSRLRDAVESERLTRRNWRRLAEEGGRLDLLHLQHHIFSLTEELGLLFDAIKMAQDRFEDHAEQKAALLLHASSSEISWRMLDPRRNLLSKLVVANINFHWLSRQDSSTVNYLSIENLSAFDGSRYAMWTEILTKHDEPANHPLLKRGLFLLANWTILAPVGGITIYEVFELSLHPLRLQLDAKVGRRIMEYIWPDREARKQADAAANESQAVQAPVVPEITIKSPGRASIDSPRGLQSPQRSETSFPPAPPLRKLGSSRSFTDLRSSTKEESSMFSPTFLKPQGLLSPPGFLKRTHSSESVNMASLVDAANAGDHEDRDLLELRKATDDAQLMKTRSVQKTFVLVKVASIHLLLSVVKEGSFECHDAKIKTRELEYRNQTWSFEELVSQFIPSDMSWRGWVKMAFHQPLVPVLPVARELLAKTKWTASSKQHPHDSPLKMLHPKIFATDDDQRLNSVHAETSRRTMELATKSSWRNPLRKEKEPAHVTSLPLTDEPEAMETAPPVSRSTTPGPDHDSPGRKRVKSLFSRKRSKSRGPNDKSRRSDDVLKGG